MLVAVGRVDPEHLRKWAKSRVGYGSLDATFWLVGMEERSAAPLEELNARLAGDALEDLEAACRRINPSFERYFGRTPELQPTWSALIRAVLAARAEPTDTEAVKAYQAASIGRAGGDTLLTELMPLAVASIGDWPYGVLGIPEVADRGPYREAFLSSRHSLL